MREGGREMRIDRRNMREAKVVYQAKWRECPTVRLGVWLSSKAARRRPQGASIISKGTAGSAGGEMDASSAKR